MLRPYTPYIISLRPSYEPLVAGVLIELRVRVPLRLRDRHQREIVRPGCLELPGRRVLAKPSSDCVRAWPPALVAALRSAD